MSERGIHLQYYASEMEFYTFMTGPGRDACIASKAEMATAATTTSGYIRTGRRRTSRSARKIPTIG